MFTHNKTFERRGKPISDQVAPEGESKRVDASRQLRGNIHQYHVNETAAAAKSNLNCEPPSGDEQLNREDENNIVTTSVMTPGVCEQMGMDYSQYNVDRASCHSVTKVTVKRSGHRKSHSNQTASSNSDEAEDTVMDVSHDGYFKGTGDPSPTNTNTNGITEAPVSPKNGHGQKSCSQFSKGTRDNLNKKGHHSGKDKQHDKNGSLISKHALVRDSGLQRTQRDSIAKYMGVIDGDKAGLNRGSSTEDSALSKESHGNIARSGKSSSQGQKVVPIRNPAVRNVTGKPEMKPGTLERHMFATPRANLTQTNAVGMIPKASGEGLDSAVVKSKMEDVARQTRQKSASDIQVKATIRSESVTGNAARQLPPLSGKQKQLPPLGVRDTEQKMKVPKADESLPQLVDRRQDQEQKVALIKKKERRPKDQSKSFKRPSVANGKDVNGTSTEGPIEQHRQESLPRPNVQNKVEEQVDEVAANILPAIESPKEVFADEIQKEERDTKSPLKTLFDQFDNFELSLSPPPASSLPPVSKTDKSYRMTYSTLPKTFDWDTPKLATRATPSPQPLGLITDFPEKRTEATEPADARLNKSSLSMVVRSSRDIYDKSARTLSRVSSKRADFSVSSSSSKSSQVSSAESVWESVSEIWQKHTLELQKLERLIALNFLPLTSAFTFSLFEIPPQYLAQNRMLREQGMQIRSLKKPKKIMMKFATKPKVMAAMRRPVKPVK